MKTCGQCKELDCYRDQNADSAACEDFTSRAIEEEPVEWCPTLEDYREVARDLDEAAGEITRLEARLAGYERAVADLVKFAQEETP